MSRGAISRKNCDRARAWSWRTIYIYCLESSSYILITCIEETTTRMLMKKIGGDGPRISFVCGNGLPEAQVCCFAPWARHSRRIVNETTSFEVYGWWRTVKADQQHLDAPRLETHRCNTPLALFWFAKKWNEMKRKKSYLSRLGQEKRKDFVLMKLVFCEGCIGREKFSVFFKDDRVVWRLKTDYCLFFFWREWHIRLEIARGIMCGTCWQTCSEILLKTKFFCLGYTEKMNVYRDVYRCLPKFINFERYLCGVFECLAVFMMYLARIYVVLMVLDFVYIVFVSI